MEGSSLLTNLVCLCKGCVVWIHRILSPTPCVGRVCISSVLGLRFFRDPQALAGSIEQSVVSLVHYSDHWFGVCNRRWFSPTSWAGPPGTPPPVVAATPDGGSPTRRL